MNDESRSQRPGEQLGRAFTHRLNELIRERELSGKLETSREIVHWMNAHGYEIKEPYFSSLKRGKQISPSLRIIEGLSKFFGVNPSTFLSAQDTFKDPTRNHGIEAVALRATGLSTENLTAVTRILDGLRATQKLPAFNEENT